MCGICGVFDRAGGAVGEDGVRAMAEALRHRGPDEGGFHFEPGLGLGHRRLSIIDLDTGRQPLWNEDRSLALVLNGEIYNYRELSRGLEDRGHAFSSRSDAEVVLHLYEEKADRCLEDLRGMFALALWDGRRRRLFFARDRLGKKPFFYAEDGSRFVFGSEIGALLRAAPAGGLNPEALLDFLQYQFIPSPRTIYRSIRKLPPGHCGAAGREGVRTWRYWAPAGRPDLRGRSEASLEEELEALLLEATRLRLVSDVPLGAFLSGGLDSGLVTAFMGAASGGGAEVKTFAMGFREASYDETGFARRTAAHLGTAHRSFTLDVDPLEALRIMARFDEPFGDASAVPVFHLSRETRRHVTVALSGDGGDELFGGYRRYLARTWAGRYLRLPRGLRRVVIEPLVDRLPVRTGYYGRSLAKKARLFTAAARRLEEGRPLLPRAFLPEESLGFLDAPSWGLGGSFYRDVLAEAFAASPGDDAVGRMMDFDVRTYLPDDILVKVDRMSMAHALETRAPFLDHKVVEFALGLPPDMKIRRGRTKWILRRIGRRYLPSGILRRPKQGFMVPLDAWCAGPLRPVLEEKVAASPLFRGAAVRGLIEAHAAGRADHSVKLWLLLLLAGFRESGKI